jgi:hypothetical protein
MRTFIAHHKSPINEYDYLAVDNGSRPPPAVCIYEGRMCFIAGVARVSRAKQMRSSFTALTIRFLDDGTAQSIPAGQFNRNAKAAPLPQPQH